MSDGKGWRFTGNERVYLDEVLSSGFGAMETGSMNERLEIKFAQIHKQKYAITANSGTSTLHMALNAFGITKGDEVILPALSVGMCGFAIWQSGGTPIFAAVFRPRCWSGKNRILWPCSHAQVRMLSQLDEVQTAPPLRPQKAFSAAVEFI